MESQHGHLGQHSRYLFGYAMRQVRDSDLAGDLVQDTFVAALTANQDYAGRSALRTWLVGILKHKIADAHRARGRAPVSLDALAEQISPGAESVDEALGIAGARQTAAHDDPERAEALRRFRESCEIHLGQMPVRSARAFLLSAVLGHEPEEIGRMLGTTTPNVWTMVHRARKRLRHALEQPVAA
jgi:RNA polymerase sigma-70 factor (ECF subfamily)